MERLLNLLQEFYGENRKFSNDDGLLTMTNGVENLSGAYAQTYIISLKGGFIKWLVENDKIDFSKVKEVFGICRCCGNVFMMHFEHCDACGDRYFTGEEELLMLLSIQNEPINFLISILN